jgi:ribonuclease H / adenosylcobalamin/alpha-ribazole phosphatase
VTVDRVVIEADGGSRGNPGPAGYGAVVFDAATRAVLAERSEPIGRATNNVAEYQGLIAGLTAARELGARRVSVRMDSKLVVEQMRGTWQVKHPGLRDLAREAVALLQSFESITFDWIPRAQNTHADRLANEAMDRAAGKAVKAAPAPAPERPASWMPPTKTRTRLVLVRHGSTSHSAALRFSGRNELPLDDAGREQAARLAKRSFGAVDAVVSSPLLRTVQTAEAIAGRLGLPVEVVDDFAETDFGVWEGLTFAEAAEVDGPLLREWQGRIDVAPPGGETFAAVGQRVERGRDAIVAAHPDATVVVVTHVTPIKWLVCAALEAPPVALFRLYLDTASVSVVDYYADGNRSVQLVNDTSHLA